MLNEIRPVKPVESFECKSGNQNAGHSIVKLLIIGQALGLGAEKRS